MDGKTQEVKGARFETVQNRRVPGCLNWHLKNFPKIRIFLYNSVPCCIYRCSNKTAHGVVSCSVNTCGIRMMTELVEMSSDDSRARSPEGSTPRSL